MILMYYAPVTKKEVLFLFSPGAIFCPTGVGLLAFQSELAGED